MSDFYSSELAQLVIDADRKLTPYNADEFSDFDVHERRFRLLCKALEVGSVRNLAGAPNMHVTKTFLLDVKEGRIK